MGFFLSNVQLIPMGHRINFEKVVLSPSQPLPSQPNQSGFFRHLGPKPLLHAQFH